MTVKGLRMRETGKPTECARLEEWDIRPPGPGEVKIRMLAAPVNPADLNVIEGTYPVNLPFPVALGNEGAGIVEETGEGVEELRPGQQVVSFGQIGAWCESRVANQNRLAAVPDEIPPDQAAMLSVNPPTAWRMVHDFVTVSPGEWIVQNAANSGVGRWVVRVARQQGIRTLNVVRRPELIGELKSEGADEVILDEPGYAKKAREIVKDQHVPLGLNAVGGNNARELSKILSPKGIMVTYGAMGRQPLEIPNSLLIFKDIRFRGFWLKPWLEQAGIHDIRFMMNQIARIAIEQNVRIPIAGTYRLEEYAKALEHAAQDARGGKVLFTMV